MKKTTIENCSLIPLNTEGQSIDIECLTKTKFEIKRVYYLFDTQKNAIRGMHAHIDLYQFIVGLNSGFDIELDDGENKIKYQLNNLNYGLLIPPGIWRVLSNFQKDSVCVVFASEKYIEADYIRNYNEFKEYKFHS